MLDAPGNPDAYTFRCADPIAKTGATLIMGIVNLTPDSFSTGTSATPSPEAAVDAALAQLAAGAHVIDFGAESSRPGAATLSAGEETARLGDAVRRLRRQTRAPISVDTYHPETARAVLDQGADMVNDITGLRNGWDTPGDPAMAAVAAGAGAHVLVMHMPAAPAAMQTAPFYRDVTAEVRDFLLERAEVALAAGLPPERVWLDPGFGFGKDFMHNRDLLWRLESFTGLGHPVAVGLSRKRMIADALGLPVDDRVEASLSLAVVASLKGASLVRVHDVAASVKAVAMADALRLGRPQPLPTGRNIAKE